MEMDPCVTVEGIKLRGKISVREEVVAINWTMICCWEHSIRKSWDGKYDRNDLNWDESSFVEHKLIVEQVNVASWLVLSIICEAKRCCDDTEDTQKESERRVKLRRHKNNSDCIDINILSYILFVQYKDVAYIGR